MSTVLPRNSDQQPYAYQLAEFAEDAAAKGLLEHILADAGRRVIDVVGNSLAAAQLSDPAAAHSAVRRVVEARGGVPEATALTGGSRLPASSAALLNGALSHSLDFDDTHLPSVLHPSSCIVPATLAIAEARGRSGRELLAAVAVGVEVCNRVGMAGYLPALRNSTFFERGLHATSICGTLGAAVGTAMLLGLDADGICSALAIAASMGAGIIEANRTGGTVKQVHCGWAAHAGIEAALLSEAGVTGPRTVLEGGFGFLRAYLGNDYDVSWLSRGLGEQWELLRTVYKPYPANHFTHPVIDCALAIREQGVNPADVESAEVGVPATVLRTIAEPRERKIKPQSPYHARFSGPFTFATAMAGGGGLGVYLDDFTDETLADPVRQDLARRCTFVADELCDREFPEAFSAVVRVRTKAGAVVEHRVHSSLGAHDRPLTEEQLEAKFRSNAARSLPAGQVEEVLDRLRALSTADVVTSVVG